MAIIDADVSCSACRCGILQSFVPKLALNWLVVDRPQPATPLRLFPPPPPALWQDGSSRFRGRPRKWITALPSTTGPDRIRLWSREGWNEKSRPPSALMVETSSTLASSRSSWRGLVQDSPKLSASSSRPASCGAVEDGGTISRGGVHSWYPWLARRRPTVR